MVVFAVTTASSVSCGDEPLPDRDALRVPVSDRLQAHAKAASVQSKKSKKYEQLKQVTRERLRSAASPVADFRILLEQAEGAIVVAASAALRGCSDLEAKMAGTVPRARSKISIAITSVTGLSPQLIQ